MAVTDNRYATRCLIATDALGQGVGPRSFGVAVSVHGHAGRLRRLPIVELVVPGYLRLQMATSKWEPSITDLSDEDIVRLAAATILPRPW